MSRSVRTVRRAPIGVAAAGLVAAALGVGLAQGVLAAELPPAGPAAAAAEPAAGPAASPASAARAGAGRVPVPAGLEVPAGHRLASVQAATGVQVYQCTAGTWMFVEPAAMLVDGFRPAAVHFRGPSWESIRDGSLVEARAVANAPVAGSIPQLLLQATRTRGDGVFGRVSYVHRLATTGGAAPTTACTDGQTKGVRYTAQYRFYVPA